MSQFENINVNNIKALGNLLQATLALLLNS